MLQIKNVNLNVGNTALLSNINLTLEQGKNYGVLGPNGAVPWHIPPDTCSPTLSDDNRSSG